MSSASVSIDRLNSFWREAAQNYEPAVYSLLLCASDDAVDGLVAKYIVNHWEMLSEMSGPYSAFAVITDPKRGKHRSKGGEAARLSYLHSLSSAEIGSSSVYSLAHELGLELDRLPIIVASADPWVRGDLLSYSVRDFLLRAGGSTTDVTYLILQFFRIWFTACREASKRRKGSRLRTVKVHVDRRTASEKSLVGSFMQSGILAQLIEGVVKGVSPRPPP